MITNMNKISHDRAMMLAKQYQENPDMKYVVYNIRRRSYVLHNPYQYYFRFSRRESVWNTRILKIEGRVDASESLDTISQVIFNDINQAVEDTMNFRLKKPFTLDDCTTMLHYYFNGKCYLAYYDYYLGRVCLIKERDKSEDFSVLIGSRYYFIDDLHHVIQYKLDLSEDFLHTFLSSVMKEAKRIEDIDGFDILNRAIHTYILQEIEKLEKFLSDT